MSESEKSDVSLFAERFRIFRANAAAQKIQNSQSPKARLSGALEGGQRI